jgi:ubiquinone/menaquinone biosynthesis C-methylase UbiE
MNQWHKSERKRQAQKNRRYKTEHVATAHDAHLAGLKPVTGEKAVESLSEYFNINERFTLLYVGLDTGIAAESIKKVFSHVVIHATGFDKEPLEFALREKRIKAFKVITSCLPYEDKQFDAVLCADMLGYTGKTASKKSILAEMARVVKDDGIILSTALKHNTRYYASTLRSSVWNIINFVAGERDNNLRLGDPDNEKSLRKIFTESDLHIEDIETFKANSSIISPTYFLVTAKKDLE